MLGRMFSTNKVDAEKSEIVLSITPRIIRSQARPASENTEFWYGTENALRGAPWVSGSARRRLFAALRLSRHHPRRMQRLRLGQPRRSGLPMGRLTRRSAPLLPSVRN